MYIENLQLKNSIKTWLIIMFLLYLYDSCWRINKINDSGLSITRGSYFKFLPPFNRSDWDMYFNLYKEIPEFKIQNYEMTLNEFKSYFLVGVGSQISRKTHRYIFLVTSYIFYF